MHTKPKSGSALSLLMLLYFSLVLRFLVVWLQDARRIAKPGAPVCLFIDWRQLPAMTLALQWVR